MLTKTLIVALVSIACVACTNPANTIESASIKPPARQLNLNKCIPPRLDVSVVYQQNITEGILSNFLDILHAVETHSYRTSVERIREEIPGTNSIAEMEYRLCFARDRGDITVHQYHDLLAKIADTFVQLGIEEKYVSTEGDLVHLQTFINAHSNDNFVLKLESGYDSNLGKLWIEPLRSSSYRGLLSKICAFYSECLLCSPDPSDVDNVMTISNTRELRVNKLTVDGIKEQRRSC